MKSTNIIGIDEVGRGAWAGPLVVGAVVLGEPIIGLDDSKQLSKQVRQVLDEQIRDSAIFVGIGWVEAKIIDEIGLTSAMRLGCERAIIDAPKDFPIIIDGKINYLHDRPSTKTLVNGDAIEPAIAAASIVAKVARDEYMQELSNAHPQYGFDKHVGYGTKLHRERLQKYGISKLHRKSYKPVRALMV